MNVQDRIYRVVKQIPKGYVLRYKDVATLSGCPSPRTVGSILHRNPSPGTIPCHRVVHASGECAVGYAFGGKSGQEAKLRTEGVSFRHGKVIMGESLWKSVVYE